MLALYGKCSVVRVWGCIGRFRVIGVFGLVVCV